jgi:hypothetical protein
MALILPGMTASGKRLREHMEIVRPGYPGRHAEAMPSPCKSNE